MIADDGPVLFIENKLLYPQRLVESNGDGRAGAFVARVVRDNGGFYPTVSLTLSPDEAPSVTLIAYGGMAPLAVEAAMNVFLREEVVVEVLLPSQVKPCPAADVIPSATLSRRVVIAEEGVRAAGWGAELASQIYERLFASLAAQIERVGARDVPIPSSRPLEDQVLPQVADIEAAIERVLAR